MYFKISFKNILLVIFTLSALEINNLLLKEPVLCYLCNGASGRGCPMSFYCGIIVVVVVVLFIALSWADILNGALRVYLLLFLALAVMTQGEGCLVEKPVICCSHGEMCFYQREKRTSVMIITLLTC